ncbi:MAG: DNA repair protein RecN [Flavobacteriales bacterium]|nr:MAG: DNA repair protein RecN [Flavobacteriales bacterium]
MLKHLSITNYAIIEHLELNINNGFTVITGETGAGKSILLGALSLILGQRADTSVLNNKEKKCIIEGEFEFDKVQYFDFFNNNELDYEDSNIIRREINPKGKSRAFINDTPVSLSVLKELTSQLIDIHSQHQTLKVQDNKFQINVVDAFANIDEQISSYRKKYLNYTVSKNQLIKLVEATNKAQADVDYISFQAKEIEELQLKPNEKEKIEAELEIINNSEEIKTVLENSENALVNSDQNILAELKNITNAYVNIKDRSPLYHAIYERLNSVLIELEDVAREIDINNTTLDFDPENLSYLNERLSKIFSIEQKHNVSSTEEILALLENLNSQLSDTNSYEEKIKELSAKVETQKEDLLKVAKKISKIRINCFDGLSKKITETLNQLGMADATFYVEHDVLEELNEYGIDNVNFLFTSNKGVDPLELKKAASGGELSRLMLTIKSILASNNKLTSIVFDEIDTGVSGDIADKMAKIMKQMSSNMQVIAITHLPQVAAKGEHHYKIYKENKNGKTLTSIATLDNTERVEELAKMLSGEKLSVAARDNAKSLLNI